MARIFTPLLLATLLLIGSAPLAIANGRTPTPVAIPEPADYLLFAAGLIVGRRAALSRRKDDDEDA